MKKTYINPAVKVTFLTPTTIIATSLVSVENGDGINVGGTTEDEGIEEGNVKEFRDWNIWD